MYILFPGRHHMLNNFQFTYLTDLLSKKLDKSELCSFGGDAPSFKIKALIFAVTSSNHSNTRRNPHPFYLRSLAIHEFSETFDIPVYIFGIEDVGIIDDFGSYTVKKINHEAEGILKLDTTNTLVLCTTTVEDMYKKAGYTIIGEGLRVMEPPHGPWDLVKKIAYAKDWKTDKAILKDIHPASFEIWSWYHLGDRVQMLYRDDLIGDDGDLTATRDYNSYVRLMDEIAEIKFEETIDYIQAGRIGDIGCAVGSWMKLVMDVAQFHESDFYGIEISRHLYNVCNQRKENGEFSNPFTFFAQKNAVTGLVYEAQSMNTIHTGSLTHEIESYGSREDLLQFIKNRYTELVPGGVWINRDVVGPEDKEEEIYLWLTDSDGRNEDWEEEIHDRDALDDYLNGLSTYTRFFRFAKDFRKEDKEYQYTFEQVQIEGKTYFKMRLGQACEYITKKTYTKNWKSEMHEKFCFWTYSQWTKEMQSVGFKIDRRSGYRRNLWIEKNRYREKIEIYKMKDGELVTQDYPITNMVLVAYK